MILSSFDGLRQSLSERALRVFIRAIYSVVLIKVISSFNLVLSIHQFKLLHSCLLPALFDAEGYFISFFVSQVLLLLVALYAPRNLLVSFLVQVSYLLLFTEFLFFGNGSDIVLNILIFVTLILNVIFALRSIIGKSNLSLLTNFTLLLSIAHFGIIYAYSGLDKIMTPEWRSGAAMYGIVSSDYFLFSGLLNSAHWTLLIMASWVVIIFESFFVVFIWIKYFRFLFFWLGILIHLFIALFMTIPDFGFVMLLGYIPIFILFHKDLAPDPLYRIIDFLKVKN